MTFRIRGGKVYLLWLAVVLAALPAWVAYHHLQANELVLIPVGSAALPLLLSGRLRRDAACIGLAGTCVVIMLGALSVGPWFSPSAVALALYLVPVDKPDANGVQPIK